MPGWWLFSLRMATDLVTDSDEQRLPISLAVVLTFLGFPLSIMQFLSVEEINSKHLFCYKIQVQTCI
mgnify:CR=1 FL=1